MNVKLLLKSDMTRVEVLGEDIKMNVRKITHKCDEHQH